MIAINIIERDMWIIRQLSKWHFMLSRQIKAVAFSGQRACDRRLKLLRENGYINKQKILYGVPSLYTLTAQGKTLVGIKPREERIRIEQIVHDINVVDSAIYFSKEKNIAFEDIITEKQLHSTDGFSQRKHHPDFVFSLEEKTYCVECEFYPKVKQRMENIIKNNFMDYDTQVWVIPKDGHKIHSMLKENMKKYTNIEILFIEGIENYVRNS